MSPSCNSINLFLFQIIIMHIHESLVGVVNFEGVAK